MHAVLLKQNYPKITLLLWDQNKRLEILLYFIIDFVSDASFKIYPEKSQKTDINETTVNIYSNI